MEKAKTVYVSANNYTGLAFLHQRVFARGGGLSQQQQQQQILTPSHHLIGI